VPDTAIDTSTTWRTTVSTVEPSGTGAIGDGEGAGGAGGACPVADTPCSFGYVHLKGLCTVTGVAGADAPVHGTVPFALH
jgi:hypothetical protein